MELTELTLCGCELDEDELRYLLRALAEDGGGNARSAARAIAGAMANNVGSIGLTAEECDTVLWVVQHPRERMVALRHKLGLGYRARHAA